MAAAEDALSEAFAAALADWPRYGCPQNPEAWLMTVARRKFLDVTRAHRREMASDEFEERPKRSKPEQNKPKFRTGVLG